MSLAWTSLWHWGAKIGGHMTWGLCNDLQWGHRDSFDLHIFFCIFRELFLCWDQSLLNLSCLRTFEFRLSLGTSLLPFSQISINWVIIGKISNNFWWIINYIYFVSSCKIFYLTDCLRVSYCLQRRWPPFKWRVKFVASLFLVGTAGLSVAFSSISHLPNKCKLLKIVFPLIQICMCHFVKL